MYLYDCINRLNKAGLLNNGFDEGALASIEIFRKQGKFSVDGLTYHNLYEVSFETYIKVPNRGWAPKFFLKRSNELVPKIFQKKSGNLKTKISIIKYKNFSDIEHLEKENIPSAIGLVKVSCFVIGLNNVGDNLSIFEKFTEQIPNRFFKTESGLKQFLIPFFELSLLNMGYVVFDPCINQVVKWREASSWQGAVLSNASKIL
jgi:hypothetical protein